MVQDLLLKKSKMTKSASINQNKIKIICDKICDRIYDLLDHLNLEYRDNGRFITMSCPIHGGDNDSALNLYYTGDTYRGNWNCRTHHCEHTFKASIIGFIRGVLSHKNKQWNKDGNETVSFQEALNYAINFLNLSLSDIKVSNDEQNKNTFINNTKILSSTAPSTSSSNQGITRNVVRKNLEIPSRYFMSRGFSQEILNKYDVGDCIAENKEMSHRAVVPIYDIDYTRMIGCTGRIIYDKCKQCANYHENNQDCTNKFPKWRHSTGFKTQESLYNLWFAKDYIKSSGYVILVESPGNVWKLEQNDIHNSVAIFGSNLSDRQKTLLDISGAMSIIVIMDNDEAGEKARAQIYNKCYRTYNIHNIKISKNDIAEMSDEEVHNEIRKFI